MRKVAAILLVAAAAAMMTNGAHGAVLFEPDRAIDTGTGLVWLNVWEGEPLVNRNRLVDVAGGWRIATYDEIHQFFFEQFGVPYPPTFPYVPGPPFNPAVGELILHLGGKAGPVDASSGEPQAYGIGGWFRSDWYPERGPTFDDMALTYFANQRLGGWWGVTIGSIGSYTSVPPQFGSPLAYFLVRPLVPEPSSAVLFVVALAGLGVIAKRGASPPRFSS